MVTYLACYSGPVSFNQDEISEVRFWSAKEINDALGTGALTPNFEEEWAMYLNFNRRYIADRPGAPGLCAGDSFPDVIRNLDD